MMPNLLIVAFYLFSKMFVCTSQFSLKIAILYDDIRTDTDALTQAAISRAKSAFPDGIFQYELFAWKNGHPPDSFTNAMKEEDSLHWNLMLDFTMDDTPVLIKMNALSVPIFSTNFRVYTNGSDTVKRSLDDDQPEQRNVIRIKSPGNIMCELLRDLVDILQLSDAMVLYDDTFPLRNKYHTLLRNLPTRHILFRLNLSSDKSLQGQLERLKETDISNYFLASSQHNLQKVLAMIEKESMFSKKSAYFAASLDKLNFMLPCKDCRVLAISPKLTYDKFLLEMPEAIVPSASVVESTFLYDLLVVSFTSMAKLMLTHRTGNYFDSQDILLEMRNFNYSGLLGRYRFGELTVPHNYVGMKLDIVKLSMVPDKRLSSAKIGSWVYGKENENVFENANLTDFLPITMYQVSTYISPPFVYKTLTQNGTVHFEGICIDLLEKLKEILQFEYEIYELTQEEGQGEEIDGEWTGIIGSVANRQADIGLAPLFITSDRERVVDFTIPFYDLVGMKILMKKTEAETSMFTFLTVMESDVWISFLAAYLITSLLLWLIDRHSPFSYQNNKEKFAQDSEHREFTLAECFWFCVTSLTPQGGGEAPKNISGRMLAATWWLFSFIVIASYTANLAAFLTVSRLENPIESLEALANQYRIQYAPINGSTAMNYFSRMAFIENKFFEKWKEMTMDDKIDEKERSKFSVYEYPVSDKYTKMWQTILETGMPNTLEEGIARIRNTSGGFALIADMNQVKYAAMTTCDLVEVGEEFSRRPMGLAVRKGSLLKEQLSLAILQLQNKRELENLKERWWSYNKHRVECDQGNSNVDGISIKNIGGVFIVIVAGMALSWVVLGCEYWWHTVKKEKMSESRVTNMPRIAGATSKERNMQLFLHGKGLEQHQPNKYIYKS